ncbi:MAG: GNAT family N-acetyltransferase [Clostridia bacterium]|nr:GNAT family N-acetyltransferase [Clostridia bacterium]
MKRVTELDRETLKYYARMAAESFVDDPVHKFATKNVKRRKKFIYHFLLERLTSSNKCDVFYVDDEARALCVWRDAHNEYTVLDFLKCPNWVFLCYYITSTVKTLMAYSHLDSKVFEKNTLIISPVFVDPQHQGRGIAKEMIKKGIEEFVPQGYKIGLETQNPDNVGFYEKLGFKIIKEEFYKLEKIHNYYMVYDKE